MTSIKLNRAQLTAQKDHQKAPFGVIDIGSNSVRLVVYTNLTRSAIPLFNEKVLCGLGEHLATSGKLSPKGVERALRLLARFRQILDQLNVKKFTAFATAAARDAKNGPDFLKRAERLLGQDIRLLSGKKEAAISALGVISGFHNADGIIGDLGGGSLELMDIKGHKMGEGVTLPLGVLHLRDSSKQNLKKADEIIDQQLSKVKWLSGGKGRAFYIVGGTWRSLIKLYMAECHYPLTVLHGYELGRDDLLAFLEKIIKAKTLSSFAGLSKVSKDRVPVLVYGALLLREVLKTMKPSSIIISQCGVREGMHYEALDKDEKKKDPLLVSAYELASLRARDAKHALELCEWTDALFEKGKVKETPEQRRLRYAACLLSDVGWRTRTNYRASMTMDAIANGAYRGVDHKGRAFLALACYLRHKKTATSSPDKGLVSIAGEEYLYRARIMGAAIRTAHMVSVGVPGVISHTKLIVEDKQLILRLNETYRALCGERLDARLSVLASLLERRPVVEFKE